MTVEDAELEELIDAGVGPATPATQTIIHEHRTAPRPSEIKVTLTRGQRGKYGWEITYNGTDAMEIIQKLREVDAELREFFGNGGEE